MATKNEIKFPNHYQETLIVQFSTPVKFQYGVSYVEKVIRQKSTDMKLVEQLLGTKDEEIIRQCFKGELSKTTFDSNV